jgi:membrane protease YdiL (CAAX protease family)
LKRGGRGAKNLRQGREPARVRWAFYTLFFLVLAAVAYTVIEYSMALGAGNQPLENSMLVWSTVATSFLFSTGALAYVIYRGARLKRLPKMFGLSRDKLTWNAAGYGIALALVIIAFELGLAIFSIVTNTTIPSTNVQILFSGTPLSFLLFSIFISPINEELFFRGLLVPRIGIILSTLVFALGHLGYGSWTELAGVLVYGLAAAYLYKKRGSLYSTVLAHVLVNALAVSQFIV